MTASDCTVTKKLWLAKRCDKISPPVIIEKKEEANYERWENEINTSINNTIKRHSSDNNCHFLVFTQANRYFFLLFIFIWNAIDDD